MPLIALAVAGAVGAAAGAASAATFSGGCQFAGTITPMPPITLIPRPGPHFDYSGSGTCGGTPATLSFIDASTLFDTCELGPDLPLAGTIAIGADRYTVTVDLLRLGLAGPFTITTRGGGIGVGVATFTPPGNQIAALEACAGAGISTASLSASFTTVEPLVSS